VAALILGGEPGKREDHFASRCAGGALAILQIQEDPYARLENPLHDVGAFDLLARQPGFLAHDQNLEGRPRLDDGQELEEPWPLDELGPTDAVIDVNVLVGAPPALCRAIAPGGLDLTRDGLLVVGDP